MPCQYRASHCAHTPCQDRESYCAHTTTRYASTAHRIARIRYTLKRKSIRRRGRFRTERRVADSPFAMSVPDIA
eukprot:1324922-Rhodomonas_salina.2